MIYLYLHMIYTLDLHWSENNYWDVHTAVELYCFILGLYYIMFLYFIFSLFFISDVHHAANFWEAPNKFSCTFDTMTIKSYLMKIAVVSAGGWDLVLCLLFRGKNLKERFNWGPVRCCPWFCFFSFLFCNSFYNH